MKKMNYKFDSKIHLHLLDGKPLTGTSSIGDVLAKPLTWWASGLACKELGWLNPKLSSKEDRLSNAKAMLATFPTMTAESYLDLLDRAYKAHSVKLKDSAKSGTDLHAELERYVKYVMRTSKEDYEPLFDGMKFDSKIKLFIEWAENNVKHFIASEAHCFDEELWVGGIVDCVAELNDGKIAVIDFKSAKEAYPTHFLQTAGYTIQIEKNGLFSEDGEHSKTLNKPIEVLIVVPFGAEKVEPQIRLDVESYKSGFRSAVNLYRLLGLEKQNASSNN
jgi:hypothetical protein